MATRKLWKCTVDLTNDEKAALATELCGMVGPIGYNDYLSIQMWWYKDGERHILCSKFDPVNNGSHMLLVLEGLVKKHSIIIHGDDTGWYIVGQKRRWGQSLGSIACTTGLAVIGKAKP